MPACKRGFARLLLFPLLLAFFISTTRAADHPNVVLIMTEDQGWGDVRSHGNDAIVISTSDNGPWMSAKGREGEWKRRYNGGMRGRKTEVDESGVRVPLFIR